MAWSLSGITRIFLWVLFCAEWRWFLEHDIKMEVDVFANGCGFIYLPLVSVSNARANVPAIN